MARYEELQQALADRQVRAVEVWRRRKAQTKLVATLMRQLQDAVMAELGLTAEDRWQYVYQTSGRDLDDEDPDNMGTAIYTMLDEHRVCLNVKTTLPEVTRSGHIAYAILHIREATNAADETRYRIAIDGDDGTFAEVTVDAADPTTFPTFAKALTKVFVDFYASLDSELAADGSRRSRIGFRPQGCV